ncbi:hypothetical protein GobsT_66920 [Gemmata obscuriglobus]|nr:hypothetical protein GobsT_66920 [Gemmata obscuriglobus]VTS11191.1 unnamed protein product [Gemmata obscuriglobus UQM 2246]
MSLVTQPGAPAHMKGLYTLIAATLLSTGCSIFIVGSGTDLNTFETREQVHNSFGRPTVSGDGEQPFDEFRTHRKLTEQEKIIYRVMEFCITLGLSEVVTTPVELYSAAKQCIEGRTVRFSYGPDGQVIGVLVDGQQPILSRHPRPPRPVESGGTGPVVPASGGQSPNAATP